jgi:hypothetical protein
MDYFLMHCLLSICEVGDHYYLIFKLNKSQNFQCYYYEH